MAPSPEIESNAESKAVTRRRLTEDILSLGRTIEKQEMGSEQRLEALRRQADLSDEREALRSGRH
jgi:hypothetical protein